MQAGFFDLLSTAERDLVLRGSSRVSYPASFIAYQGPGTAPLAMVVETGLVRLFVASEDGRQASIDYLHPGDIYAADEVIPPGPANIQALEDSVVVMIDPKNLFRLAAENLDISGAGDADPRRRGPAARADHHRTVLRLDD